MTTRQAFHELVDTLSEIEAEILYSLVKARREDPFLRALAEAPIDDEPTTADEDAEADEAWQSYLRGEGQDWEEAKQELGLA